MEELLLKYGYLFLFVGVVIEGEAFLLAGAFLAHQGYFHVIPVAGVALAANALGAQFYYMAARTRGRPWFENRFKNSKSYRRIFDWMGKYGNWLLVLSRFAVGFRMLIPAACGAFGMPMARFVVLNLVGGLLWVIPTALLGFYFGSSIETVLRQAYEYLGVTILAAALIVVVYLARRYIEEIRTIFQRLQWSDLHAAIPSFMGFMAILNIITAIWPSTDSSLAGIQQWLPLEASEESRTMMLFSGIALFQVTRSLATRKQLAWYVALITLSISLALHLVPRVDVEHSLVAGLLLTYLIYYRRRFYTRSDPVSLRKGLFVMPLLGLIVFFYGLTGLYATYDQFTWPPGATPAKEAFRSGILIVSPDIMPISRSAGRFLGSLQIAGWMARVYILVLLLRPFILRDRLEAPREDVARIFRQYGNHSLAALAVQPDKHHLLLLDGRAMIAYAWKRTIALSCGDPLVADDLFADAVNEYSDHCRKRGWKPCVYLAAEERLGIYKSLGFESQKVAEEAVIDLGMCAETPDDCVTLYDRAHAPDPMIDEQLEEISEDWLYVHHVGEMGFTGGHFSLESLGDGPVFILGNRNRVQAFCAWLPYRNGSAMVLDLIRQRHTAPAETMETLLANALARLRDAGIAEASIATATLGREQLERFHPDWKNQYLVYPGGSSVKRITDTIEAIQKRS